MSNVVLGQLPDDGQLRVDIPTLVDTRALITGNSGAGKSRLLRRLAEQAFGKVQILVLDPEGEFATLREKHDFLLAGKGGEVPAEPRAAGLLARRLMQLRTSAVLDLYDLKVDQQRAFVHLFLEELLTLPRDQYRPVLVMIDEVHRFAPEDGKVESTEAVVGLMSQGRKRGLCGILASQRLSKVAKDAAADAANGFIGRTTLDVDQARAGDVLGITKAERIALRDLDNGYFHSYGPAINHRGVVLFRSGEVETTHPKAGQRHKVEPPAPPEAIRKLAEELKDLPAQAAEELRTMQAAKARIRQLEGELKKKPSAPAAPAPKRVDVPVLKDAQVKRLEAIEARTEQMFTAWTAALVKLAQDLRDGGTTQLARFTEEARQIKTAIAATRTLPPPGPAMQRAVGMIEKQIRTLPPAKQARALAMPTAGSGDLTGPERKLLSALAQYPDGRTVTQLAILTGYAKDGGAFKNPLGGLRSKGYAEGSGVVRITEAGLDALGPLDPLPSGDALRAVWYGRLSGPERKILGEVVKVWPNAISIPDLAAATNYEAAGGAFKNPLGRLRTLELVHGRGEVRASNDLFDA